MNNKHKKSGKSSSGGPKTKGKTPNFHKSQSNKNYSPDKKSARTKSDAQHSPKQSTPKINIGLYGIHAVQEAWKNPLRAIKALYVTQSALDGFDLTAPNGTARPAPTIIDKKDLDYALPKGAVHQGIGLHCVDLPETGVEDLIIAADSRKNAVIVILDQVTDPHNVGAIIRSCAAFGAAGVVMQRKHAPDLTGVLAKTACGGVEHMPVAYETNLSRTLDTLRDAGYLSYGLDERGDIVISDIKKGGKTVLVLGAEGSGLRRLVAERCDALVRLPTQPPIASLNVSNAAAVALYATLG